MTGATLRHLSSVILCEDDQFAARIERTPGIELRRRLSRTDELPDAVQEEAPDVLFLDLGDEPDAVLEHVEKLDAPAPLLVFCGPDQSELILKAMRAGAREYIAKGKDQHEQLCAAVQRLAAELPSAVPHQRAAMIAVMGAKGGVGATFVACQLAAELARSGDRVALVDGHLRMGDIALHLDLSPQYSMANLAGHSDAFDSTYLRSTLTSHASGVHVLASPGRPEEADVVSLPVIERVIQLFAPDFDWVVWDTPRDFDDRSVLLLDRAEGVLLVTTPDVPAMHHTKLQLDLLARLGHDPDSLRTVVNRVDKNAPISDKETRTFLKRGVDAMLPNDYARASACVNEGRTIHEVAARSPLAIALAGLAGNMRDCCGRVDPNAPKQRSGLFARLRRN
jgi:pilus assembly protein CpaE